MNKKELKEYYKGYDKPDYRGYLNAEVFCLETRRVKLTHTSEDLREVEKIDEKLEYLATIKKK